MPTTSARRSVARAATVAATGVLAPVLFVQGRRTARRTPRLEPASGPDRGSVEGAGPPLRLVVVGESTAVGVGAASHAEALPGFLAQTLGDRLGRAVTWSVCGRQGATARKVIDQILPQLEGSCADLVVLSVGVNDLLRRRPLDAWAADMTELIAALQDTCPHASVIVAGLPPVRRFPAIPQPLRFALGARARAMDDVLRQVASRHGACHAPLDECFARDPSVFASDRVHPSSAGYRTWAGLLAQAAAIDKASQGVNGR